MSYISSTCKEFISCAKEVYQKLDETERKNIKYKDFVGRAVLKYNNGCCNESLIKSGYRFLRTYYLAHPLNKNNPKEEKKLSFDAVKKLLDFDDRECAIKRILGDTYNYYWYEQRVNFNGREGVKRYFLTIESRSGVMKELYKKINESYKELFSSMYLGFRGITIVFSKQEKLNEFVNFIKK